MTLKRLLLLPLWKTLWQFPKEIKLRLLYDLAIPLLGIYPKEMKTEIQSDIFHIHVHSSIVYSHREAEAT